MFDAWKDEKLLRTGKGIDIIECERREIACGRMECAGRKDKPAGPVFPNRVSWADFPCAVFPFLFNMSEKKESISNSTSSVLRSVSPIKQSNVAEEPDGAFG